MLRSVRTAGLTALCLALLAAAPGRAAEREDEAVEPINLIVQVVDDLWLPLRDASVTASAQTRRAETYRAMSDGDGFARFSVPANVRYSIRVSVWGYKEERVRSIRAWSTQPIYVQVKLRE